MDPEIVDSLLRNFLKKNGLLQESQETLWKVDHSKLSGRGLIATRDIDCDELVYTDVPLVIGPRCYSKHLPMCVSCFKKNCTLFPCDHGCGLPVCSDLCQDDPVHAENECTYLQKLRPTCGSSWSLELLQTVVPIRALLLPYELREIFLNLQCHEAPQHGQEVNMLQDNVKKTLRRRDEKFMRQVCRAMDTNSFETAVVHEESSTSLRALFPVGALTNHQCVPNTRHIVNVKGELCVYSTKPIPKGDEITMTYTDLLWDTTLRRQFLQVTKHFSCKCSRCFDITEYGTLLGALFCAKDNCSGNLLPEDPLNFSSAWRCGECGLTIKNSQISSIRAGIAAALEEVLYTNPRKIYRFIQKELDVLVPSVNYVMMEMMFRIVSIFGRTEGYTWKDLSNAELDVKIVYCNKLLQCLDALNCGDCTKKGLILYELYCTNVEKLKRMTLKDENLTATMNEKNLLQAVKILKNDMVAPIDYRNLYKSRYSTD